MHGNRKPVFFRLYARRNGLKIGVLRLFASSSGCKGRYELSGNLKQDLITCLITAALVFRFETDQILLFETVI